MDKKQIQYRKSVADTCNKQAVINLRKNGTLHNAKTPKYKEKIPTVWLNSSGVVTLNYKKYLKTCKLSRRAKINNRYPLSNWMPHVANISNEEIIQKRWELELRMQDGLMAIIQAQILDSLVIGKSGDDDEDKMKYDPNNLENISFLLNKFTNGMGILPETKAVSSYNQKYIESVKKLIGNNEPRIPQGNKDQHLINLSLIAKAEALSEIQGCKLINDIELVCINEESCLHKKLM